MDKQNKQGTNGHRNIISEIIQANTEKNNNIDMPRGQRNPLPVAIKS